MKTTLRLLGFCVVVPLGLASVSGCSGTSGVAAPEDGGHDSGVAHDSSTGMPDRGAPDSTAPPQDSGIGQDSAAPDSTVDSGVVTDSEAVDSGIADSAPDTNLLDSNVPDTNAADSNVVDSNVADTGLADSNVADTAVADTSVGDAAEAGAADSGMAVDSAIPDGSTEASAGTYTIGGIVTGLAPGDSLEIEDNGGDSTFVAHNGAFTFPTALATGQTYTVTVLANPQTPTSETCNVTVGMGTVGMSNVTDVVITCTVNGYTLGGNIYGLATGASVSLQNGGGMVAVTGDGSASQPFQFSALVPPGGSYDVTVAAQPSNQICYVSNPTGTPVNNVSSLVVKCRTGLVAYYPFDEGSGTTMHDVTGNGNDGLHNASYVPGATATSGTALAFNGSQGGTVTGNAAFTWGAANADYTVDYWLLTNVVATNGNWTTIFHKSDATGGNFGVGWERSPAEWFYPNSLLMHCPMSTAGNSNNAAVQCSPTPITIQQWTHFAAIHSGAMTAEVVYINGVLANTIPLADTSVGGPGILFLATGPGGYNNLNGNLDEVRIYSRALSQAEIQADMQ